MSQIGLIPFYRAIDANGTILPNARLYTFLSETLTPQPVYTTEDLDVSHGPYVQADANGLFPPFFPDPTKVYRYQLRVSPYSTAVTGCDASGITSVSSSSITFLQSGSGAEARTVEAKLRELKISVMDFGAVGDGETDDTAAINLAIASLSAGQTLFFPKGNYYVTVQDEDEQTMLPIPIRVDVEMESDAWILGNPDDPIWTAFMPLGSNRLKVNVDGRSLLEADAVEDDTFLNDSQGIRAYFDADYGRGATDVEVYSSKFRNLRYGIQTEGCKRWNVHHNDFELIKFSANLHGCRDAIGDANFDCTDILTNFNTFRNLGDTFCACYETVGNTTGKIARIAMIGNVGTDASLLAAGFAFDIEAGSAALQTDILIANNVYGTDRADINLQRGGIIANTCNRVTIIGNDLHGGLGTNADVGIVSLRSSNGLIASNRCDSFRGGGVNFDGSLNMTVQGNHLTNCGGGDGNSHSIIVAQVYDSTDCNVLNNTILNEASYAHYTAGSAAVGAIAASGKVINGLTINGNVVTAPLNIGFKIQGLTGTHGNGLTMIGNSLNGRSTGNFFGGAAIDIRYMDQVTIDGLNVKNATSFASVRDCVGVTLEGVELKGSVTLATGYTLSGSTLVRTENVRCYQTVTTAISNAGTGTIWGLRDDLVPVPDYANDAAAAGGGVPVGGNYRNGSVIMRRIA